MKHPRSVIVVGGGVIGLAAAHEAARRGMRVTVLERGAPDSESCSHGNAGMVVPSHYVPLAAPGMLALGVRMLFKPGGPFFIRPRPSLELVRWGWAFARSATRAHVMRAAPVLRDLHLLSRKRFIELSEAWGSGRDFGLARRGLLALCRTPRALEEEARVAELADDLGVPVEVLDARGTADLDPGVRFSVAGSVYFPQDCHLDPAKFSRALGDALREAGGEIRWGAEVRGWDHADGRIRAVETDAGRLEADAFVLAGGAWSPELTRPLGIRLPMQAGKGYSVTLPEPRELPTICALLMEARVAVTPMGGTLRVGGTMEIAGNDSSIDPARLHGILRSLPEYFPAFRLDDFAGLPVWAGLRPCSPDGLPYVGRFECFGNLVAATGHAMMGLSLAPVTGLLVAEILAGDRPSVDLSLLAPDRFGKRRQRPWSRLPVRG